jgi:hypothetical protein
MSKPWHGRSHVFDQNNMHVNVHLLGMASVVINENEQTATNMKQNMRCLQFSTVNTHSCAQGKQGPHQLVSSVSNGKKLARAS